MNILRQSRLRSVVRWMGFAASTLLLASWAVSGWWYLAYHEWEGYEYSIFSLHEGVLMLRTGSPEGEQGALQVYVAQGMGKNGRRTTVKCQDGSLVPRPPLPRFATLRSPRQEVQGRVVVANVEEILALPLWLPFVLIAAPTIFLFWRERRQIPPGCCLRCGYDLTGNASGTCPECGTPIPDDLEQKLSNTEPDPTADPPME